MTGNAITISVKVPPRILQHLPAPGNGRSGFIIEALEEKISRRQSAAAIPDTKRGRKLAALLAKGKKERFPLLSAAQFERELAERRGRQF